MNTKDQIKNIQIYNQNNELIYECRKGFSFPVKYVNNRPIDNVLMIKNRHLPVLHIGAVVDVVITTRGGDRIKYFCQVDFSNESQMNITLHAERAKQLEDKRRFYKIKTEINCRIVDVTRGESVTTYTPNLYSKIRDINIGGIFTTFPADGPDQYAVDDVITFTAILGDQKLEAQARILRVQKDKDGAVIGYGCCFASLNSRQEEIISAYINKLQIEERRLEIETEKLERELKQL